MRDPLFDAKGRDSFLLPRQRLDTEPDCSLS